MTKHARLITLAALVIAALAAIPAAASALPTYSTTSTFTGTSGESILTTAGSSTEIVCKKDTNSGEVKGGTGSGTFTVDFTECKSGAANCKSAGDVAGTILTTGTTTLGYITKEPKDVGVLLAPVETVFECSILKVKVKGKFICLITPINEVATAFTQKCEVSGKGKQKVTKFEGGAEETLEASFGGAFEKAALKTEEKLTNKIAGKIEA